MMDEYLLCGDLTKIIFEYLFPLLLKKINNNFKTPLKLVNLFFILISTVFNNEWK